MATTFEAIRDHLIGLLEALTPTDKLDVRFRQAAKRYAIRDIPPNSAALRKFDCRWDGSTGTEINDCQDVERTDTFVISMAYPVGQALYGRGGRDDHETLVRRDVSLIRDLLLTQGSWPSGCNQVRLNIPPPIRTEKLWIQQYRCQLVFLEAQSLG